VLALPEGVNTALNHHGSPLQPERILRLAMARAIVGRPRLLLLHEVFDHVDPSLVPAIAAYLLRPGSPWTAVISTQNPAVLAHCNRICRLEAGRLSEVTPVSLEEGGHG
jgi:ABC-type bacteriocin/lantibiotic exporter with double-glycine peptidase domain